MALHLTPLPAERFDGWLAGARQRVIDGNRTSGMRVGADAVDYADRCFAELFPEGLPTPTARVQRIVDDEQGEVGTLGLVLSDQKLILFDLAVGTALSEPRNDDLLARILAIASETGADQLGASVFPQDAAGRAFVDGRGFEIASIQMVLEPLPVRARADARRRT